MCVCILVLVAVLGLHFIVFCGDVYTRYDNDCDIYIIIILILGG